MAPKGDLKKIWYNKILISFLKNFSCPSSTEIGIWSFRFWFFCEWAWHQLFVPELIYDTDTDSDTRCSGIPWYDSISVSDWQDTRILDNDVQDNGSCWFEDKTHVHHCTWARGVWHLVVMDLDLIPFGVDFGCCCDFKPRHFFETVIGG